MSLNLYIGEVTQVNTKLGTARVEIPEIGLNSYDLQVLQPFAGTNTVTYLPNVGDRVAVALGSDGVRGVVMGGIYDAENPTEGAAVDLFTMTIPNMVITGDLEVRGDITHTGNTTRTGDVTHTGDLTQTGTTDKTGNVNLSGFVAVTGRHTVNGSNTTVLGGMDSRGDTLVDSGQ